MKDDLRRWLEGIGERFLRKVGIRRGQVVLDFGCGLGNYTIPIAKIVGSEGIVYALDKDARSLDKLMRRAELEGLRNIRRIDTSGEVEIKLSDNSVDVVLLYDIFWYFPPGDPKLKKLLTEVYRISKPGALISVLPKHVDPIRLKDEVEDAGFKLKNKISGIIIHDGTLEDGYVLNFIKSTLPSSLRNLECWKTRRKT
ncbi:class I SAM-dependent methyltransferase [Candidatus Bathyarchaeota archaeon]|nr:class I SAM-dependent methyltransferase [Candidatus Bathyarchaeota archaeon]